MHLIGPFFCCKTTAFQTPHTSVDNKHNQKTHSATTNPYNGNNLDETPAINHLSVCKNRAWSCDLLLAGGWYLPVVAFLAQLFLEVSQSEAVGLHHAAIRDLLTTEEVGDHKLLWPKNTKLKKKKKRVLKKTCACKGRRSIREKQTHALECY